MKKNFYKIYKYFDKIEDKIRRKLIKSPIIYAFIGSLGVVMIWRGLWGIADELYIPYFVSLIIGILLTISTGLFVSFFVGDSIVLSGLKKEKRVDEKTEKDIREEKEEISKIENEIEQIHKQSNKINKIEREVAEIKDLLIKNNFHE